MASKVEQPATQESCGTQSQGTTGRESRHHTLAMAFVTYALVVVWYLKHGEAEEDVTQVKKEAPWYLHKQTPSFCDMLAGVRRDIWAARFSAHPVFKRVSEKVRELLPSWLLAA